MNGWQNRVIATARRISPAISVAFESPSDPCVELSLYGSDLAFKATGCQVSVNELPTWREACQAAIAVMHEGLEEIDFQENTAR